MTTSASSSTEPTRSRLLTKFIGAIRAALWILALGGLEAQAASIQFSKLYIGSTANTAASDEPPTITITGATSGTFTFTSADPAAALFSGNDVSGTLSGGASPYAGVISRRSKTGNVSDAFYFYQTSAVGDATPLNGGVNILLIVPGREASTTDNSSVGISSDPIDEALNDLLPTNTAPVNSVPAAQTVNEDTPLNFRTATSNGLSAADTGLASVTLTVTNGTLTVTPGTATISAGASGTATVTISGNQTTINTALNTVTYQGTANFFGSDTLTMVSRDSALSDTDTVSITVSPVNDVPSFTKGADQTVNEDAGAQTVTGWSSAASSGPANESAQTLSYTVTNNNNALFSAQPAIDANGTLSFTPATNASGTATVSVKIVDNGGTTNGGINESAVQTFVITVTPINDAPAGTDATFTTAQNAAYTFSAASFGFTDPNDSPANTLASVIITTLPASGSLQLSSVPVTAGQEISVANLSTLSYVPNDTISGNAATSFTFQVRDNGTGSNLDLSANTITFNLTAVNHAPQGGKLANGSADPAYNSTSGRYEITTPEDTPISAQVRAYDRDGDTLTYTRATAPTNGTVVVTSSTGAYTYTPNANYTGTDSFTVTVSDGNGGSVTITVFITVTPVNDAPVGGKLADGSADPAYNATSGRYEITTPEDTPISAQVRAYDRDGDTLTYTRATAPTNGTVVVTSSTGAYTYTPNANYTGTDSFTVTVSDGNGGTVTITVFITVTPVNDAPVGGKLADGSADPAYNATSGRYEITTPEDTPISAQVRAYDRDGDTLTYTRATAPTNGTVVVTSSTGAYTYTPNANYTGTDSFTVTVSDGNGGTVTITVFITVTPVNDAPVGGKLADGSADPAYNATSGRYEITTPEDTPISAQVRAYDRDGDTLTYTRATAPTNGTVVVTSSTGAYTYTPNANYTGTDSFTVTVSDGNGGTVTITVFITVTPVNDAPVGGKLADGSADPAYNATSGRYEITTPEDTPISGRVRAFDGDGDPLTYTPTTRPTNGNVFLEANGAYIYTPGANYNGSDSFTVLVSDGNGGTTTISVFITVTPVNDDPVPGKLADGSADPAYNATASRYEISTPEDTPISGRVKAYDVDGDPLTYAAATQPANGSLIVNADGSYTYTPKAEFNGTDSFTVLVSDGRGGTALITVFVTVTPVNDAPVPGRLADGAADPAYNAAAGRYEISTNQDTRVSGQVRAFDIDRDPLTFTIKTAPTQGTVTLNPNGGYTYSPAPGYFGEDSFRVTVSDGNGGTAEITVYVRIYAVPVNTLPQGTLTFTSDSTRVVGPDGSVFKVADGDSPELTVNLRTERGYLTLPERSGVLVLEGSLFNDSSVTIKGTIAALNAVLAQLQYQAPGGFVGKDSITITSTDERGSSDTDRMDPPFSVELATLGGRNVSASIGTLTAGGPPIASIRVEKFDPTVITGAEIIGTDANSRLQLGTPTRQDGSVQKTTVTVEITYANGTKESFELKVTVYNPKLALITALSLNAQTSLYEQKVQITNTTPYQIDTYRVVVPTLPSGVTLYSRHTVGSDGRALIEDTRPLAPGENRVFVIEYFSPNLARFTEPALKLEVNSAGPATVPLGTTAAVDRVIVGANNRTYVEFTTIAGRNYWVQYRDGANGLWQTSPASVSGTGTTLHWLDEGMPKTVSAPTAAREYRLIVASATAAPLTLVTNPVAVQAAPGSATRLQVTASGTGPFTYQWFRDGVAVNGATAATFDIARTAVGDEGEYTVAVSDGRTSIQSKPAAVTLTSANPGRIVNLAVRAPVEANGTPLITGFVLEGSGSRQLLTRAVGETLGRFGVTNAARDPALKLYRDNALLAENDDWNADVSADLTRTSSAAAGAFGLTERSKDAALLRRLVPSAYTLHTANKSDATGAVLVEIYDAAGAYDATNRIVNVSTRARVTAGDGALIAGFVISGDTSCRILARAVGPTLSSLGVSGSLADPTLTLYRAGTDAALATNDDWSPAVADGLFARVGAFELPVGSKDAVLATRLPPGAYTLVAQGKGAAEGHALIELYLIR